MFYSGQRWRCGSSGASQAFGRVHVDIGCRLASSAGVAGTAAAAMPTHGDLAGCVRAAGSFAATKQRPGLSQTPARRDAKAMSRGDCDGGVLTDWSIMEKKLEDVGGPGAVGDVRDADCGAAVPVQSGVRGDCRGVDKAGRFWWGLRSGGTDWGFAVELVG